MTRRITHEVACNGEEERRKPQTERAGYGSIQTKLTIACWIDVDGKPTRKFFLRCHGSKYKLMWEAVLADES